MAEAADAGRYRLLEHTADAGVEAEYRLQRGACSRGWCISAASNRAKRGRCGPHGQTSESESSR